MPWMAVSFVTQDGPSHLYTAVVARDLLLNPNSPYAELYRFQPKLVTNWSTTVLMNIMQGLFGSFDAEHAMATLCVIAGFFGFAYLRRSVDPLSSPWSPTNNFLLCSWFLWIGFYNFYLGMALFPFVAGYYIRHANAINRKKLLAISGGLLILFFTHVMGFALALMSVGLVGLWACCSQRSMKEALRPGGVAGWGSYSFDNPPPCVRAGFRSDHTIRSGDRMGLEQLPNACIRRFARPDRGTDDLGGRDVLLYDHRPARDAQKRVGESEGVSVCRGHPQLSRVSVYA